MRCSGFAGSSRRRLRVSVDGLVDQRQDGRTNGSVPRGEAEQLAPEHDGGQGLEADGDDGRLEARFPARSAARRVEGRLRRVRSTSRSQRRTGGEFGTEGSCRDSLSILTPSSGPRMNSERRREL
ncbi:hypothetical protein RJ55_08107 [Drechmeria coniospora]|nr:hypothetical protein RJ55_08107 [Drechmeria coniospora]